jgi:hypothetical protein
MLSRSLGTLAPKRKQTCVVSRQQPTPAESSSGWDHSGHAARVAGRVGPPSSLWMARAPQPSLRARLAAHVCRQRRLAIAMGRARAVPSAALPSRS